MIPSGDDYYFFWGGTTTYDYFGGLGSLNCGVRKRAVNGDGAPRDGFLQPFSSPVLSYGFFLRWQQWFGLKLSAGKSFQKKNLLVSAPAS